MNEIACSCSGFSTNCTSSTGFCLGCSGNTGGNFCDQCLPGFKHYTTGIGCTRIHSISIFFIYFFFWVFYFWFYPFLSPFFDNTKQKTKQKQKWINSACSCSGLSSSCDGSTGVCSSCTGNTGGNYCDQCLSGFTNYTSGIGCSGFDLFFFPFHIQTKKTKHKQS